MTCLCVIAIIIIITVINSTIIADIGIVANVTII